MKVPIHTLRENPENPRSISGEKFEKLVNSIRQFPEMMEARPIVVDQNNVILGGNMRFKAAKEAGLQEVDVYVASWDEAKNPEFIIKDNVGFGEWDWDMLANEWDAVLLDDWGLDVWQEEEEKEGLTDPDEVPEVPADPVTQLGDLWILGEHRLLCGDSTKAEDVERLMDGKKADMLHTDPPYGVDYEGVNNDNLKAEKLRSFLKDALTNAFAFLREGANVYVWHADVHAYEFIGAFRDSGFTQAKPSTIQWVKDSLVLSQGDYHSRNEPCLYGWKAGKNRVRVEDRKQDTIWEFPKPKKAEGHPTMKPVALCRRAISNSSRQFDAVLDLFGGSGSTLIACEQDHRSAYLIELDPSYCDLIVKRWEDFTGQKASKANA